MNAPRLLVHLGLWLALAALGHLTTVWAVPRVVMQRVMQLLAAPAAGEGALFPPPTDHRQRRVVMPSPDLLYASCVFDLARGPLHVRFDGAWPHYWSIALYASNSDNFFVLNDRAAGVRPLELVLRRADDAPPPAPARAVNTVEVAAPSARGLLLLRLLVTGSDAELAAADAARRRLRCEPL